MANKKEQEKAWEEMEIPGLEHDPDSEEPGEARSEAARNAIAEIFIIVEAWKILAPLKGKVAGPVVPDLKDARQHLEDGSTDHEIKINALFSFFSGRNIEQMEALSADQTEELKAHFFRLDSFIFEGQKDPQATIGRLIVKFLELEPQKEAEDHRPEIIPEDKLPLFRAILPKKYSIPNNLLVKDLRGETGKAPINAGEYDLPTIPGSKKLPEGITTYVNITEELRRGIKSNLSPLEFSVWCAALSVWQQAKKSRILAAFTVESIYQVMTGKSKKPSEKTAREIEKAVDRLVSLRMEIDATDELKHRRLLSSSETFHMADYFLPAEKCIYRAHGGQKIVVWRIKAEKPLILRYAEATGQLISIPMPLLAVKEASMNPARIAMRDYMAMRIEVMRHDIREAREKLNEYNRRRQKDKTLEPRALEDFREIKADKMLFASIFAAGGIQSTDRWIIKRNRDFCFTVLDGWKGKLIADYSTEKGGAKSKDEITAVRIEHL